MKIFVLAALLAVTACAPFIPSSRWVGAPMFVVSNLEAAQLKGRWYEVASVPTRFQAGCYATVAEYTARDDGLIGVRNTCRVEGQPGVIRRIEGTAAIVGPGQLQVRLDGVPFPAKYWVLNSCSRPARCSSATVMTWLPCSAPDRGKAWHARRQSSAGA